jgi:hypothetical protein
VEGRRFAPSANVPISESRYGALDFVERVRCGPPTLTVDGRSGTVGSLSPLGPQDIR